MPEICFENVNVNYEDREVLRNINLTLTEHRIGVIGANGGGKSTLIRLINGLGAPTTGKVIVNGLDVSKNGKHVRRQVGFVFSDAENQIIMPTVEDDVAFSLRRLGIKKAERLERAHRILEQFQLMGHAQHSPHLLSGGQKQLLALAAVLVLEPDIIVADEPTTLLDMRNRRKIRAVFDGLSQQMIVVTHDLDFLSGFDRVLCVHNNTIVADGAPSDVISFYENLMDTEEL
ncbi:ABC-type cobalt transport system, ATPase component [Corynebacterium mustelae]|uniref:ABC-type cobalt transport system, ATPase component n=1 Tax=Corynebacterium mustelae TaxID=571915 RepID=A0A0G3H2X9_9CORY|nr:ABC transporter ATP-binding protein [Corynebacterium mustelae]AKK06148.1 ABC-type cobalt transport system, ATPase component [Corynebacterium mustelae]